VGQLLLLVLRRFLNQLDWLPFGLFLKVTFVILQHVADAASIRPLSITTINLRLCQRRVSRRGTPILFGQEMMWVRFSYLSCAG
jgi:hypothetical protein